MRVGILGAGAMGLVHAAAWQAIEGIELAGIFSRDAYRAARVAADFATQPCSDARTLIDDTAIDAIDVCLPSHVHAEHVVAALQRGKHVFCETPFALDLLDAETMLAAAAKSGRLLLVGLLMRALPHYRHVHDQVRSGALGRLITMSTHRLGSYLRAGASDHKPHYSDPSIELMTFDFDFLNWTMGKPARVSAAAAQLDAAVIGEITATLDYGDGRSATVTASGMMPTTYPFSVGFRAGFEKGAYALATVFDNGPLPSSSFRFYPAHGAAESPTLRGHNPYEWELRYFVDCVRNRADPALLHAERAVEALRLSLATQTALREGRTVALR